MASGGFRLVVFDVEGVLVPKNRYLLFEVCRGLGLWRFLNVIFYGVLYEVGLVSLKFALANVLGFFRGFKVERFLEIFRRVPLLPGVELVFDRLKRLGFKMALISSGLPDFVVSDLAIRLGADYAYGFSLEIVDGLVTGRVSGDVLDKGGKRHVLKRILEREGLEEDSCVVVADDRNNLPMMLSGALKIGFNPDFLVRVKADHVVTGSLDEILPLIGVEKSRGPGLPSKNEVLREVIHACGFAVPFLLGFLGLYPVVFLILVVTLLYSFSMVAFLQGRNVPFFSSVIRRAALTGEIQGFAFAPVFFALGISAAILVFQGNVGKAAVAIFAFGDSAASIFGRFGSRTLPFNKGKTLEGFTSGFLFGFLGALFFVSPLQGLAAAALAMIVECLPLPLSDNITVPITAGAFLKFALGG